MAESITHFKDKRQPPLEATISTDGSADPLPSGATVAFSMRLVGSPTLKVSAAAATVVSEPLNQVRYDWAALDVDTVGEYLGWWTVTATGQSADTPEFLVRILPHTVETHAYLELEEAKSTLELESGHADADLLAALVSASRIVDEITQTRFFTTTADEIRYYSPDASHLIFTDEINTLTELATDDSGGSLYATVWTPTTDYLLEPLNAALDGRPWNLIRRATNSARYFRCYPRSVRITGKFGWAAPPEAVRDATGIIATKIIKRKRDAPMGIITAFDGTAVRMSSFDPQVEELLRPYNRSTPFA